MRIIYVLPSLKRGGAERLCLDIIRELKLRDNIEVKLLLLQGLNEYEADYSDMEPIVLAGDKVQLSILSKWDIQLNRFNKIVEEFSPDVIHSHLYEAEIFVHNRPFSGVKYVTHFHDNMVQLKPFSWADTFKKKRIIELYERNYLLKQYANVNKKFIAISEDTKKYFTKNLPAHLTTNIVLLPNAINVNRFTNDRVFNKKKVYQLVNIGSFVKKKNQRFLIDILLELNRIGVDCKLQLIGEGALLNQVKEYAKQVSLVEKVEFCGNVNNVEEYLRNADFYVHSATYEPFGLVLLEAMASGLPVISIDGDGNRDFMKNGENGYLINKGDVDGFVSAIRNLIDNKDLLNTIHLNSIKTAKKFDIGSYVDRLLSIYSE